MAVARRQSGVARVGSGGRSTTAAGVHRAHSRQSVCLVLSRRSPALHDANCRRALAGRFTLAAGAKAGKNLFAVVWYRTGSAGRQPPDWNGLGGCISVCRDFHLRLSKLFSFCPRKCFGVLATAFFLAALAAYYLWTLKYA